MNYNTALQSQAAVTADFPSKQLLLFIFAWRPQDHTVIDTPANTSYWAIVGSMLARRLRRRPNIEPAMAEGFVIAGIGLQQCYE